MKERNELKRWIKEHKKELIIAGISIVGLIIIIWGIKNRNDIIKYWELLRQKIKECSKKVADTTKVTMEISQEAVDEVITDSVSPEVSQDVITAVASDSKAMPFDVRQHLRNLPEGMHASPEKIAAAQENNIVLQENQTWVNSYTKRKLAA